MELSQIIDGIGAAVASAKPVQEYCLFFFEMVANVHDEVRMGGLFASPRSYCDFGIYGSLCKEIFCKSSEANESNE